MQKIIDEPTKAPPGADGLEAMALRAAAWAGEPFLHDGEDPAVVLAPGTARRQALDEAVAEIESGRSEPTPEWKVRFSLMLGLERVLSEKPPHLASGTELRRHQIDALAGMLTELIAANQRAQENGNGQNGNGHASAEPVAEEDEDDDEELVEGELEDEEPEDVAARPGRRPPLPLPPPDRLRQDDRRRGLRRGRALDRRPDPHPPPAAREPVPARADRRGLRRPAHARDRRLEAARDESPDHDPDVRLVRAARGRPPPRRVPARDLRRGAHRARREDERRDPQLPRARSTSA